MSSKGNFSFIPLDIKDFYSFINYTLNNALNLLKQHISIPDKDLDIIKHYRRSILYYNNKIWTKKHSISNRNNGNNDQSFDITMGSYDDSGL